MNGLRGHYPSPPPSYPVIARAYPARGAKINAFTTKVLNCLI
jgi:hypothetical protein